MRTKITLNTFRRYARTEEQMIRLAMPNTSAADPEPLAAFAAPVDGETVAVRNGVRLVRPVRFTLGEVARG